MNIEFICDTQELYTVLNNIKAVIPERPSHPILADVLITTTKGTNGEDDTISFTASDLGLWIVAEIKAIVETAGSCCIPYKVFFDQIQSNRNTNKDCHAIFTWADGDTHGELLLTFNRGKYQINTNLNIEEYPEIPNVSTNQMQLNETIAKTMAITATCASKDETKQVLTGIQFQVRQYANRKTVLLAGTDGYCLYKSELDYDDLPSDVPENECVIEHQVTIIRSLMVLLDKLIKPTTENIKLSYDETRVAILVENYLIIGRTFEGDYPAFEKLIPAEFYGYDVLVNRKNLLKMSERIGVFSKLNMDTHKKDIINIMFHLDTQSIEMTGDAKEFGNADEQLSASISIPQDSLATGKYNSMVKVTHPIITKGLKLLQDSDVRLRVGLPHQPIVLEPFDNKNNEIFLLMPKQ